MTCLMKTAPKLVPIAQRGIIYDKASSDLSALSTGRDAGEVDNVVALDAFSVVDLTMICIRKERTFTPVSSVGEN